MSGRDMPAYDANLLAQAPEPTKEQKQSGYQTKGLLDDPRAATPSRTPAPVAPEAGGSNGRSVDLLEKGSVDERPAAGSTAVATPAKRPWYRRPVGWIIVGAIIAAIIIAAVVGGVVGTKNSHSGSAGSSSSTGSSNSTSSSNSAPGQFLPTNNGASSTGATATTGTVSASDTAAAGQISTAAPSNTESAKPTLTPTTT